MSAVLVADSQMFAYVGDEAFHLLAAKLVSAGRTPYQDFFYQHPPLFIYIVGGIFRLTGASWRVAHSFSALALIGGIVLAAFYARDLFQEETLRWRNAAVVAALIAFNCYTLVFGVTGFPQGFCILCLMAALYFSRSRERGMPFLAGLFAGCAAEASLLAAPALVVFVIWLALKEKRRALWFVAGATVAFMPLIVLMTIAPDQTFADVFRYHLFDRPKLGWRYDVGEILAWFGSLQGVVLSAFAIAAVSLRKDDDVRLCGWIALAMVVTVSVAKTTAASYFLPATPFIAILAGTGLIELTQQTDKFARRIVAPVVALYLVGLVGLRYVWRSETFYFDHRLVENIVQRMERCSSTARMNAPEAIYFAWRTLPPRGFENRFDPFFKGTQDLKGGQLDAILIDASDPRIAQFNLNGRYARHEAVPLDGDSIIVFCDRI